MGSEGQTRKLLNISSVAMTGLFLYPWSKSCIVKTSLVPRTGALKAFQPQWRWDDITPTNLIPTNTGELGLGGPANI